MSAKKLLFAMCSMLFLSTAYISCNKSDDNNNPQKQTAKMTVHLTDGPAAYDAVYIDIKEVQVQVDNGGWTTIALAYPGVYDLLDLRNGIDTLLGVGEIPAGKVTQMRLILGANNAVVVNGVSYNLTTPSAQESGLKINFNETFVAGGSYDVWIDFDAGKSIHETGNGKYMLKPVMRGYTALTNGRIKGFVAPAVAPVTVYAIMGTDTLSAIPAVDGYFMFSGLQSGTYTIWVDADGVVYQDVSVNNITVSYGVITDVGIIAL